MFIYQRVVYIYIYNMAPFEGTSSELFHNVPIAYQEKNKTWIGPLDHEDFTEW